MAFVHLHCRSYFSLKDGAFSPEGLARRAAELGMPAVALTDRDGLYGAPRFVAACREAGVKPILGAWLTLDVGAGRPRPERTIVGGGEPSRASSRSGGTRRGSRARRDPSVALRERGSRRAEAVRGATGSPRPREAGTTPPRILLIARHGRGYANVCRLITAAHLGGERGEPGLEVAEILERAEGLVALLGPESPPGALAAAGFAETAREAARPWREAFGEGCYVEVRNLLEPESPAEIRRLLRLADEVGVPAVATNAVRHLVPEDAFLADALECMRELVPVDDRHVSRWNAEGFLKSARAMRGLFAGRPDLCDNTLRIAEACDVDLGLGRVHFPDFLPPRGRSATSVLAERCFAGLRRRGMGGPEVRARLDHELDLIHKMGYAAYFLTVADIVDEVKAMGIRCACRGSAAGSLVCYATGISEVDPIRHGLLFERFLNPLRDELPDVDLDVESARREEVYEAVLARYGEDRCACVCMVDTYRARAAIREVGKALGYPDGEVGEVAKAFPHIGAGRIREAVRDLPELRGSNLGAGQLEMLFRVAERLDGFPRHIAQHPSGIVLSGSDLPDRVPMERSFLGHRMVQADKDDVEALGLLKLDVLGVRMLSAMRHALDEIERTTGKRIDLDRLPANDPAAWELIGSSNTVGCFQIESPGQRELLQKFQPARFEDLIVDISLFRPGPVKPDMVRPFLNRHRGLERPHHVHGSLRPALRETHGVIVYHEQVMRVLAAAGGYDPSEADCIRRRLGDEDRVPEIRDDFLARARRRGLSAEDAERVWREVAAFASFGFCKAHAAAFAVPTYQSAWLKANHPAQFLAGVLTHEPGMYPRRLILEDARRQGVAVLPLDVNRSERDYAVEVVVPLVGHGAFLRSNVLGGPDGPPARDSAENPVPTRETTPSAGAVRGATGPLPASHYGIRLALRDVDGISDAEIDRILEARRERPFASVGDFLRRTGVSRPVTEALAHAGAFDALDGDLDAPDARNASSAAAADAWHPATQPRAAGAPPRCPPPRELLGRVEGTHVRRAGSRRGRAELTRRDRLFQAMTIEAQREGEQATLMLSGEPGATGLREYTDAERVRAELEVLGLDASRHLVSFYEPLLSDLGVVRARDLGRLRGDAWVMVAGVKVASQTPAVRSGQRIIFLTLDDATGPVDVTVFERAQERCARTVFHASLLAVWGRLRRTGVRGTSIIAEEAWDLVALGRARGEGRLAEALALGAGERDHLRPRAPRKFWHSSGGSAGW